MADDLDLNEVIEEEVEDATVITVPIDDTLTASGEAADAKAVGDALALKADRSELAAAITVNGQGADAQGVIIVTAEDTAMSSTDETTVKEAVEAAAARTGADIPISGDPGAETIAEAIAGSVDKTADMIAMSAEDQTTVAQAIGTVAEAAEGAVKSVNGTLPDSAGDVQISEVPLANNLTAASSQSAAGAFVIRTTGGSRSVASGEAYVQEIRGVSEHEGYVPEEINWSVNTEGNLDVASLDRDTFVGYVEESGTITLTYSGSAWSADPSNYGLTLSGTPVNGDTITIVYVKEERGTIRNATPGTLRATGWNLYNNATGYARVVNYEHNYHIGGSYTSIAFSATYGGARSPVTVTNGSFSVPGAGWIWVTGGNATNTYITTEWTDWTTGPSVPWEAYTESVIDISSIMTYYFTDGMFSVGTVYDSLDFDQGAAISRIERMAYTEENRAAVIASGRAWDADEDYIYAVRVTPASTAITISGTYTVSDHGLEMFEGTDVGPFLLVLYGQDLKSKLAGDVLTISQQTLTAEQKAQVQANTGVTEALAEVLNSINSKFLFEEVTVSTTVTVAAGSYESASVSPKKTGYTPVGIAGVRFSGSGSTRLNVARFYIGTSGGKPTVFLGIQNTGTSGVTNASAYASVIWMKN